MIERWTRLVLRFRWAVLALWLGALLGGGYASTRLTPLLSNTFTVPGTDSERARTILQRHFGDRSDGTFTVVFQVPNSGEGKLEARLQAALERAARVVPHGQAGELRPGGAHVLYGDVVSGLDLQHAKGYTDGLIRALRLPGGPPVYVTGQAAIQHDLDPILSQDLKTGTFLIAIPIAAAVLLAVFGLSVAITIPFLFAASTIVSTLGIVFLVAHFLSMATYVRNLVELIGLGISIDYSLLIVYRFREELAGAGSRDEAIARTMATAGRAVIFSGATVAIGLALLLFMPLPFMRSMGVGGLLIPLVSIVAAATLQPALLSVYGRWGTRRFPLAAFLRGRLGLPLPRLPGTADVERGVWARLSRSIMRRPAAYLAAGTALLVAAAIPVFALKLTPGSASGIPQSPQSVHGFDILKAAVGPGAISPTQIVVDAGRGRRVLYPGTQAAIGRLVARLERDSEAVAVRYAPRAPFLDQSGRYAQVVAAGRHEYGQEPAQRFVHRLRAQLVPGAAFPAGVRVLAGGGPPQGVDFLERSYSIFPWLVLAVLALTYLVLLRAFRSLLLPLKAVVLNLLSVAASYGVLVVVFKWGVGSDLFGLYHFAQVEGWIPIFLFAMLFGLSMDYEVFLVTRMRESWDDVPDNARAVAHGLERTGRIITAAAVIMVAAFSGLVYGRIVGLQEFGLGLGVAIFVDATIVRIVLVPSLMAVLGRYNWWLPERVARLARVRPSPLAEPRRPALRPAGR